MKAVLVYCYAYPDAESSAADMEALVRWVATKDTRGTTGLFRTLFDDVYTIVVIDEDSPSFPTTTAIEWQGEPRELSVATAQAFIERRQASMAELYRRGKRGVVSERIRYGMAAAPRIVDGRWCPPPPQNRDAN